MSRRYIALVKRELLEHAALWIAPLAIALLVLLALFVWPGRFIGVPRAGPGIDMAVFGAMTWIGTAATLGIAAAVATVVYLLDCLSAERRDRSILFWKSLPVSDAETVLATLFVAMVVVPLGVMLLALLVNPLALAVMYLRYEPMRDVLSLQLLAGWPVAMGRFTVSWVFGMLWYLPFAAYLMLASVLARRAPLVYAAMPPLVLILWERLFSEGNQIGQFISERVLLGKWVEPLLNVTGSPAAMLEPFKDPALWLGVAVGAGMLYTVIRLRRYRDDS